MMAGKGRKGKPSVKDEAGPSGARPTAGRRQTPHATRGQSAQDVSSADTDEEILRIKRRLLSRSKQMRSSLRGIDQQVEELERLQALRNMTFEEDTEDDGSQVVEVVDIGSSQSVVEISSGGERSRDEEHPSAIRSEKTMSKPTVDPDDTKPDSSGDDRSTGVRRRSSRQAGMSSTPGREGDRQSGKQVESGPEGPRGNVMEGDVPMPRATKAQGRTSRERDSHKHPENDGDDSIIEISSGGEKSVENTMLDDRLPHKEEPEGHERATKTDGHVGRGRAGGESDRGMRRGAVDCLKEEPPNRKNRTAMVTPVNRTGRVTRTRSRSSGKLEHVGGSSPRNEGTTSVKEEGHTDGAALSRGNRKGAPKTMQNRGKDGENDHDTSVVEITSDEHSACSKKAGSPWVKTGGRSLGTGKVTRTCSRSRGKDEPAECSSPGNQGSTSVKDESHSDGGAVSIRNRRGAKTAMQIGGRDIDDEADSSVVEITSGEHSEGPKKKGSPGLKIEGGRSPGKKSLRIARTQGRSSGEELTKETLAPLQKRITSKRQMEDSEDGGGMPKVKSIRTHSTYPGREHDANLLGGEEADVPSGDQKVDGCSGSDADGASMQGQSLSGDEGQRPSAKRHKDAADNTEVVEGGECRGPLNSGRVAMEKMASSESDHIQVEEMTNLKPQSKSQDEAVSEPRPPDTSKKRSSVAARNESIGEDHGGGSRSDGCLEIRSRRSSSQRNRKKGAKSDDCLERSADDLKKGWGKRKSSKPRGTGKHDSMSDRNKDDESGHHIKGNNDGEGQSLYPGRLKKTPQKDGQRTNQDPSSDVRHDDDSGTEDDQPEAKQNDAEEAAIGMDDQEKIPIHGNNQEERDCLLSTVGAAEGVIGDEGENETNYIRERLTGHNSEPERTENCRSTCLAKDGKEGTAEQDATDGKTNVKQDTALEITELDNDQEEQENLDTTRKTRRKTRMVNEEGSTTESEAQGLKEGRGARRKLKTKLRVKNADTSMQVEDQGEEARISWRKRPWVEDGGIEGDVESELDTSISQRPRRKRKVTNYSKLNEFGKDSGETSSLLSTEEDEKSEMTPRIKTRQKKVFSHSDSRVSIDGKEKEVISAGVASGDETPEVNLVPITEGSIDEVIPPRTRRPGQAVYRPDVQDDGCLSDIITSQKLSDKNAVGKNLDSISEQDGEEMASHRRRQQKSSDVQEQGEGGMDKTTSDQVSDGTIAGQPGSDPISEPVGDAVSPSKQVTAKEKALHSSDREEQIEDKIDEDVSTVFNAGEKSFDSISVGVHRMEVMSPLHSSDVQVQSEGGMHEDRSGKISSGVDAGKMSLDSISGQDGEEMISPRPRRLGRAGRHSDVQEHSEEGMNDPTSDQAPRSSSVRGKSSDSTSGNEMVTPRTRRQREVLKSSEVQGPSEDGIDRLTSEQVPGVPNSDQDREEMVSPRTGRQKNAPKFSDVQAPSDDEMSKPTSDQVPRSPSARSLDSTGEQDGNEVISPSTRSQRDALKSSDVQAQSEKEMNKQTPKQTTKLDLKGPSAKVKSLDSNSDQDGDKVVFPRKRRLRNAPKSSDFRAQSEDGSHTPTSDPVPGGPSAKSSDSISERDEDRTFSPRTRRQRNATKSSDVRTQSEDGTNKPTPEQVPSGPGARGVISEQGGDEMVSPRTRGRRKVLKASDVPVQSGDGPDKITSEQVSSGTNAGEKRADSINEGVEQEILSPRTRRGRRTPRSSDRTEHGTKGMKVTSDPVSSRTNAQEGGDWIISPRTGRRRRAVKYSDMENQSGGDKNGDISGREVTSSTTKEGEGVNIAPPNEQNREGDDTEFEQDVHEDIHGEGERGVGEEVNSCQVTSSTAGMGEQSERRRGKRGRKSGDYLAIENGEDEDVETVTSAQGPVAGHLAELERGLANHSKDGTASGGEQSKQRRGKRGRKSINYLAMENGEDEEDVETVTSARGPVAGHSAEVDRALANPHPAGMGDGTASRSEQSKRRRGKRGRKSVNYLALENGEEEEDVETVSSAQGPVAGHSPEVARALANLSEHDQEVFRRMLVDADEGLRRDKCFVCQSCQDRRVGSLPALIQHLRYTCGTFKYENNRQIWDCTLCDKKYKQKARLVQHMKTVHPADGEPIEEEDGPKKAKSKAHQLIKKFKAGTRVRCPTPDCGKSFTTYGGYKYHAGRCGKQLEFEHNCGDCGKKYASKRGLVLHVESCHTDRPAKKVVEDPDREQEEGVPLGRRGAATKALKKLHEIAETGEMREESPVMVDIDIFSDMGKSRSVQALYQAPAAYKPSQSEKDGWREELTKNGHVICPFCKVAIKTMSYLGLHVTKCTKRPDKGHFTCLTCQVKYLSKRKMLKHLNKDHRQLVEDAMNNDVPEPEQDPGDNDADEFDDRDDFLEEEDEEKPAERPRSRANYAPAGGGGTVNQDVPETQPESDEFDDWDDFLEEELKEEDEEKPAERPRSRAKYPPDSSQCLLGQSIRVTRKFRQALHCSEDETLFHSWNADITQWKLLSEREAQTYHPRTKTSCAFMTERRRGMDTVGKKTACQRLPLYGATQVGFILTYLIWQRNHNSPAFWTLYCGGVDISLGNRDRLKGEDELDNNSPVFFAGGPVRAAAWCPYPEGVTDSYEYLAVSCFSDMDHIQFFPDADPSPSLIQIWSLGVVKDRVKSTAQMMLGLAHDYGVTNALAWGPSGGYQPATEGEGASRLGLLAAACATGVVVIHAIPHPDGERPLSVYKPTPQFILRPVRNASAWVGQCFAVDWSQNRGHAKIAAGFGNGSVSIWNLNTTSGLLKGEVDSVRCLYPVQVLFIGNTSIRSVRMCPTDDCFLTAVGENRFITMLDTRFPDAPLNEFNIATGTDCQWPLYYPLTLVSTEKLPLMSKGCGVFPLDPGHLRAVPRVIPLLSAVWSVSVSDWLHCVVGGSDNGHIGIEYKMFGEYKSTRREPKVLMDIALVDIPPEFKVEEDMVSQNAMDNSMDTQEDKEATVEGDARGGVGKPPQSSLCMVHEGPVGADSNTGNTGTDSRGVTHGDTASEDGLEAVVDGGKKQPAQSPSLEIGSNDIDSLEKVESMDVETTGIGVESDGDNTQEQSGAGLAVSSSLRIRSDDEESLTNTISQETANDKPTRTKESDVEIAGDESRTELGEAANCQISSSVAGNSLNNHSGLSRSRTAGDPVDGELVANSSGEPIRETVPILPSRHDGESNTPDRMGRVEDVLSDCMETGGIGEDECDGAMSRLGGGDSVPVEIPATDKDVQSAQKELPGVVSEDGHLTSAEDKSQSVALSVEDGMTGLRLGFQRSLDHDDLERNKGATSDHDGVESMSEQTAVSEDRLDQGKSPSIGEHGEDGENITSQTLTGQMAPSVLSDSSMRTKQARDGSFREVNQERTLVIDESDSALVNVAGDKVGPVADKESESTVGFGGTKEKTSGKEPEDGMLQEMIIPTEGGVEVASGLCDHLTVGQTKTGPAEQDRVANLGGDASCDGDAVDMDPEVSRDGLDQAGRGGSSPGASRPPESAAEGESKRSRDGEEFVGMEIEKPVGDDVQGTGEKVKVGDIRLLLDGHTGELLDPGTNQGDDKDVAELSTAGNVDVEIAELMKACRSTLDSIDENRTGPEEGDGDDKMEPPAREDRPPSSKKRGKSKKSAPMPAKKLCIMDEEFDIQQVLGEIPVRAEETEVGSEVDAQKIRSWIKEWRPSYQSAADSRCVVYRDYQEANFRSPEWKAASKKLSSMTLGIVEPITEYSLNAVTKVVWSPNFHSRHWLLVAGQNGIVRLINVNCIPNK